MNGSDAPRPWFSESFARGLQVIRAFGRDAPRQRIADVAVRTGLTRAAARRYLLTLQELGLVGTEGDMFFLHPRVLDLGYSYLASIRIDEFVEPLLKGLSDAMQGWAHVAVHDRDEVLFVAGVPSRHLRHAFTSVGGRMPAYAGSLGQVLLAGLPDTELDAHVGRVDRTQFTAATLTDADALRSRIAEVRRLGYAVNRGEYLEGIVSVAVPIRSASGEVIAAINANRYSTRQLEQAEIDSIVALLRECAAQVERRSLMG